MTNADKTRKFFEVTTTQTVNMILDNIARNYGITRAEAKEEVLNADAESLLDYVTGPERAATRVLMQKHRLA